MHTARRKEKEMTLKQGTVEYKIKIFFLPDISVTKTNFYGARN